VTGSPALVDTALTRGDQVRVVDVVDPRDLTPVDAEALIDSDDSLVEAATKLGVAGGLNFLV
jgi:hypothetical protein